MVHIYTGIGKGKTTAAFGVITRMLGYGNKVCLIQLMKKNSQYGEIMFFQKQPNIDIFQYGTPSWIEPGKPSKTDIEEAKKAVVKASEAIVSNIYDLVVIDEINIAVSWDLIPLEEQLKLFDIPTYSEIIMTGRYAAQEVKDRADLVTEMKEVKHYFEKGILAREGIEY